MKRLGILIGITLMALPVMARAADYPVGSSWTTTQQGGTVEYDGLILTEAYSGELAETGTEQVTGYLIVNGQKNQQSQQTQPFAGLKVPCGCHSTASGTDSSNNLYNNISCTCAPYTCGSTSYCCANPGNHVLKAKNYGASGCNPSAPTTCKVTVDNGTLVVGY